MSGPPVFVYTLPMPPKAAPRPRVTRRGTFNPTAYTAWKRDAILLLSAAKRNQQIPTIEVACALLLEFTLPRPQNPPRKGSLHRDYWHPTDDYPYPCKPDLDNLTKAVKDAMTGAHIWADDCLVVSTTQDKHAGDTPRIDITINLVHPETDD